jgi:peptidoglycan/xylan/chitin deacetylase (PgdA/CDA1 family)
MRPPYGALDTRVRVASQSLGQRIVNWSLDSRDWTRPGARSIAGRVVGGVRPGSIVLMHDGGGERSQSVAALRAILRTLGRQGYTFSTLPVCR